MPMNTAVLALNRESLLLREASEYDKMGLQQLSFLFPGVSLEFFFDLLDINVLDNGLGVLNFQRLASYR
jgi:hypothetical protein